MAWLTKVGGVGGIALQLKIQETIAYMNRACGNPNEVNHVDSFKASYQMVDCAFTLLHARNMRDLPSLTTLLNHYK